MASLIKKKIRGHAYYYARECKRVKGKPKIVWQKYLGRADDIVTAVIEHRQGSAVPEPQEQAIVTEFGAVAALYDLAGRLNLVRIVDEHVPKRGSGPSVGTYLLLAVLNRCVAPSSKAGLGEWFDKTILRRLVEVNSRQLTSQRYWDNMDRISIEDIAAIEADLTAQLVERFEVDLSRLLFDATNFFTFIDSFNERSTLAQRGKSKEGRSSLRIIGVALLVSADFHLPLLHHTYPGNQPDAPTFKQLIDPLAQRIQSLVRGVEDITLVFDKGNNSLDNLEALEETSYSFVGSLVPTQHSDLLGIPREEFHSLAEHGLPGVSAYRTSKSICGHERRVVVTFNENLFVAQCQTLLREIAKRQRRFVELNAALERWRKGEIRKGLRPTVAGVRKKINGWLKARHMKDLFAVEVKERDGLPDVVCEFNQPAWEELQATLLGKTLLFTNRDQWGDAEIVRAYRAKHHVEDAFREMKDSHHIALRPQYCWTDQKVRVHVFTCVIALMLASLLRQQLSKHGIRLSARKALGMLAEIREVAMIFPPTHKDGEPTLRTSMSLMSDEQKRIFEVLELERYAKV
jgi:transposase